MDQVLAFVEGSLPNINGSVQPSAAAATAAALRLADAKLRRVKRKEVMDGDQRLHDCGNDESVPSGVSSTSGDSPCSSTRSPNHPKDPSSVSSHPKRKKGLTSIGITHGNSATRASAHGSNGLHLMDDWLTSEIASHLMVHDDFDDDVLQKKEKEFVLVQKKRKQKIAVSLDGIMPSYNGLRLDTQKTTNGFALKSNGIIVSRNSSEVSFTHLTHSTGTGSDIDDLSHFVGEDHEAEIFDGELFVDARTMWDNEKDESCTSVLSVESSDEILPLTDDSDWRTGAEAKAGCLSDELSTEIVHKTASCVPEQRHDCSTDVSSGSPRSIEESNSKPSIHSPSPVSVSPDFWLNHQQAVVFLDARAHYAVTVDTSTLTFLFGCTLSDHLAENGPCKGSECSVAAGSCEISVENRNCKSDFRALPSVGNGLRSIQVSFMFCDSVPENNVVPPASSPAETETPPSADAPVCPVDDATRDGASCSPVERSCFRVADAQTFLHELFQDAWADLVQGQPGVVMYSSSDDVRPHL